MRLPDAFSLFTVLISAGVSAATGYISSRLTQRIQERKATGRWRLALASEIRTLRTRLMQYELAFESRVLTGELLGSHALRLLLQPGDISVFTHNASSIGLFDTALALRVLRFYADIRTLQGHAIILEETVREPSTSVPTPEVGNHLKMLRNCKRQAQVLVHHLRHEDNTLKFARQILRRVRRRWRSLVRRAGAAGSGALGHSEMEGPAGDKRRDLSAL